MLSSFLVKLFKAVNEFGKWGSCQKTERKKDGDTVIRMGIHKCARESTYYKLREKLQESRNPKRSNLDRMNTADYFDINKSLKILMIALNILTMDTHFSMIQNVFEDIGETLKSQHW